MTKTNESGRSMVEMLGVLAIIGVLSVMGIAGYTQAMKKYRLNEAVASVSMAAMLCGSGQGLGTTFQGKYVTVNCGNDAATKHSAVWSDADGFAEADLDAALAAAAGDYDASKNTYTLVS